jgi:hypothetical protein
MTNEPARHPDSPRGEEADAADELNDVTRVRQQDLGHPHLDEELDRSDVEDVGDDSRPGQNSDWLPQ